MGVGGWGVGIWRSDRGREFPPEGPADEKARWPAVVSLVRGTLTVRVSADIEVQAVREVFWFVDAGGGGRGGRGL